MATFFDPSLGTRFTGMLRGTLQQLVSLFAPLTVCALQASGAVTITSTPDTWAVVGGVYRYTLTATNTDLPPTSFAVVQKPAWLNLSGATLSGTPSEADFGTSNAVTVLALAADGVNQTSQTYTIRVGRFVGPVSLPQGGGSATFDRGMPAMARATGDGLLLLSTLSSTVPTFWGLAPDGFALKTNYTGPSGDGGSDFTPPSSGVFTTSEFGLYAPSLSNTATGVAVWQGLTNKPTSIGGAPVATFLKATAVNATSLAAVPLRLASDYGLPGSVGVLARIPSTGLKLDLRLNAEAAHPSGTPALDWFNALANKLPTDRTVLQFNSAFYWVNTVPRLTANNGLTVQQDNAAVLTTAMLNVTDTEHSPSQIRFALGDGTSSGLPLQGILETLQASTWSPVAAGGSFTLAQVAAGQVRYRHGGSYVIADSFQFRVLDGENALARDGANTVFSFPIRITLINHAPVPTTVSCIPTGLGATVTGTFAFTDPDIGHIPQSFFFTLLTPPASGTFEITNATTGAYRFTAGSTPSTATVTWSITDGYTSATGTTTFCVANQSPVISPLSLTGTTGTPIVTQVAVVDPDLPLQSQTITMTVPPTKGTVALVGNQLTYTAHAGRFGDDQFSLTATDSAGAISAPRQVSVSIRPDFFCPEALFVSGQTQASGANPEGVVQRIEPSTGDVYTLARDLGGEARGLVWSESLRKLLVLVVASDGGTAVNALVKVDPVTGEWGMDDIVTMGGSLVFPINVALDGANHVLIANGSGPVVRVSLVDGSQTTLPLGLPGGAFVTAAAPSPDGGPTVLVASIADFNVDGDGNLFACNRSVPSATAFPTATPVRDPGALLWLDATKAAVARSCVFVHEVTVNPPAHGTTSTSLAPWLLPVSLARSTKSTAWYVTDAAGGPTTRLYRQTIGQTSATAVSAAGLCQVFGVAVVRSTSLESYSAYSAAGLSGLNATNDAAPKGDNVPNLLKFAFNMDLTRADARRLAPGGVSGLPRTSYAGGQWTMEFIRRSNACLIYTPKYAVTLDEPIVWIPITAAQVSQPIDTTWERVSVTLPLESPEVYGTVSVDDP